MTAATFFSLLRPTRSWLQYRLRTMFVLVIIAAIPCIWIKWTMDQKRRERVAVAEIKRMGGYVTYDWQVSAEKEPPGPVWLRTLLGDDFFSSVKVVVIGNHIVNDDWLVHLEPLSELSVIFVESPHITDAGVRYLTRFTHVAELSLSKTAVSDSGLVELKRLTRLRKAHILLTAVTDAGVAELQKALPNCRIIR